MSASGSAPAPAPTRGFSVEYTLYPPTLTDASGSKLPPTHHKSVITIPTSPPPPPPSGSQSETSAYYSALSTTLKSVQKTLNEDLTLWKDAIGDLEKHKEDPGTIGFGRGKAAIMSEDVRGELKQASQGDDEGDSDSSDEP